MADQAFMLTLWTLVWLWSCILPITVCSYILLFFCCDRGRGNRGVLERQILHLSAANLSMVIIQMIPAAVLPLEELGSAPWFFRWLFRSSSSPHGSLKYISQFASHAPCVADCTYPVSGATRCGICGCLLLPLLLLLQLVGIGTLIIINL